MIRNTVRESCQSLPLRIAALLALALLPIGLISVATTHALLKNLDSKAEANLLALTAKAAAPEESAIRTGIGAATMFAAVVPELRDAGLDCQDPLREFIENGGGYTFAGYADRTGTVVCASDGLGYNISDLPLFNQIAEDPRTRVSINEDGFKGEEANILVLVPVLTNGQFDGVVTIAFPHGHGFATMQEELSNDRPLDLITYNADAEILTSTGGLDTAEERLPANIDLARLSQGTDFAFIDWTNGGKLRVFAVVPIVPGEVFALGSWSHKRDDVITGIGFTTSVLFPVAMWVVCLGVGFFAVQRMVIRPTRNLRARMLTFMRSRRLAPPKNDFATPREIREMEETWTRLANNVLADEARLHDIIQQRTVLLKEVHHRVKNNLQLIVSILNMKVRKAQSAQEKATLSEIRQRVMGIARVHQNLYETSSTEKVHAGELLRAIVGETVRSTVADPAAIEFEEHYEDVVIYPDQAVPLSLAVTELLTNALKNMGTGEANEKKPLLSVRLTHDGQGAARFQLCNSVAETREIDGDLTSSGLGMALIKAFTQQLGGAYEAGCSPDLYSAGLRFPIAEFDDTGVPDDLALAS